MATKDKCMKALDCLADDDKMDELAQKFSMDDDYTSHVNYEIARKWCYDKLKQCIDEHFSNPPLQFEELKEGMWVWDNQLKWFFRVVLCDVKVQGCESLKMFKVKKYEGGSMLMIYEPNRFYRKEVQE